MTIAAIKGDVIILQSYATAPAGVAGAMYYNSTDKKVYYYNGSSWLVVGRPSGAQYDAFPEADATDLNATLWTATISGGTSTYAKVYSHAGKLNAVGGNPTESVTLDVTSAWTDNIAAFSISGYFSVNQGSSISLVFNGTTILTVSSGVSIDNPFASGAFTFTGVKNSSGSWIIYANFGGASGSGGSLSVLQANYKNINLGSASSRPNISIHGGTSSEYVGTATVIMHEVSISSTAQ